MAGLAGVCERVCVMIRSVKRFEGGVRRGELSAGTLRGSSGSLGKSLTMSAS